MRVAWFTPLPPMPSGIADYSSEIVPYVAERAEVDVFCPRPGVFSKPRVPRGATLRDPRAFDDLLDGYDAAFYHLGNNPYHEFVYKTAKDRPGIAVFHDADLHHLIAAVTIELRRDPTGYEDILREELGEVGGRVATLRRLGLATEFEKFVFPLIGHVASRAKGIVVHSEDARLKMLEVAPDVPMTVIPHHAGEPPPGVAAITRDEARRRLGIPADVFVVGHLGFITKPKQPGAVVGGFARLHREFPGALLYMVGADRTGGALAKLIDDLGVGGAVRMAGYVDLAQFYLYLKALDVMINLRYPSAGESSGTFSRALAEGRAVIVNNYGSFSEVPGDVALKVEIDSPQPEQVGEHLLHLARRPEFRAELEARAREYAVRVLDPNRCRDLYLAFAERVGPPDRTATDSPPRRVRTTTLSDAVAIRHRLAPALDELQLAGAGPAGAAVFVDALCRLLLRRPADDDEIREAHAALAAGLSRAELLDRIVASQEFAELRLLDELIEGLRRSPGPLRIDRPVGPGTTGRAVQIAWVASRVRGARRLLGMGLEDSGLVWASALTEAGVAEVHGVDDASRSAGRRVVADPGSLPYRDGSFDGALCLGAPAGPALAELVRVLRQGGRLVVTAPLGESGRPELDATAPLSVDERVILRRTALGWVTQDASLPPGAEPSVLCLTLLKDA